MIRVACTVTHASGHGGGVRWCIEAESVPIVVGCATELAEMVLPSPAREGQTGAEWRGVLGISHARFLRLELP